MAGLVIEAGGTEDEAIAALLHDAVEDAGGEETLAEIRAIFGDEVAGIVDECSDTVIMPKPPWKARKQAYVDHLSAASEGAVLVSLERRRPDCPMVAELRRVIQAWREELAGAC